MQMRITRTEQGDKPVLRVEGGLSGAFVNELLKECDLAGPDTILDLCNLRCLDSIGAAALFDLSLRGVEMRSVSTYVDLRMQQQSVA